MAVIACPHSFARASLLPGRRCAGTTRLHNLVQNFFAVWDPQIRRSPDISIPLEFNSSPGFIYTSHAHNARSLLSRPSDTCFALREYVHRWSHNQRVHGDSEVVSLVCLAPIDCPCSRLSCPLCPDFCLRLPDFVFALVNSCLDAR
jgi:hypothetical protein